MAGFHEIATIDVELDPVNGGWIAMGAPMSVSVSNASALPTLGVGRKDAMDDTSAMMGGWTMIYNEGFHVSLVETRNDVPQAIHDFSAFSWYKIGPGGAQSSNWQENRKYSDCAKTLVGWYHVYEPKTEEHVHEPMHAVDWLCWWGEQTENQFGYTTPPTAQLEAPHAELHPSVDVKTPKNPLANDRREVQRQHQDRIEKILDPNTPYDDPGLQPSEHAKRSGPSTAAPGKRGMIVAPPEEQTQQAFLPRPQRRSFMPSFMPALAGRGGALGGLRGGLKSLGAGLQRMLPFGAGGGPIAQESTTTSKTVLDPLSGSSKTITETSHRMQHAGGTHAVKELKVEQEGLGVKQTTTTMQQMQQMGDGSMLISAPQQVTEITVPAGGQIMSMRDLHNADMDLRDRNGDRRGIAIVNNSMLGSPFRPESVTDFFNWMLQQHGPNGGVLDGNPRELAENKKKMRHFVVPNGFAPEGDDWYDQLNAVKADPEKRDREAEALKLKDMHKKVNPWPGFDKSRFATLKNLDWRRMSDSHPDLDKHGHEDDAFHLSIDSIPTARDQGPCGSCYDVAISTVLTSRLWIRYPKLKKLWANNNKVETERDRTVSWKHNLDCNHMNQGCEGGYPYFSLLWGQDVDFPDSDAYPHTTTVEEGLAAGLCRPEVLREKAEYLVRVRNFGYIGGAYGRCHFYNTCEEEMRMELYRGGPIGVAIEPSPMFGGYSGGQADVLRCHDESQMVGPNKKPVKRIGQSEECPDTHDCYIWERVDHAIVALGWGEVQQDGELVKYWIIQNSWGESWNGDGTRNIERGTNCMSIETITIAGDPVLVKEPEGAGIMETYSHKKEGWGGGYDNQFVETHELQAQARGAAREAPAEIQRSYAEIQGDGLGARESAFSSPRFVLG